MQKLPLSVAAASVLATTAHAQSFSDNFDDGNDAGWTQSNPLSTFGVSGEFSFPDGNSYRIRTTVASPDQEALGPARTGSLREDITQTDFRITVDLVDWDDSLTQDIGILARIGSPGLGTLTGYGFSYDNNGGAFFLTRIDGEVPETLGSGGFLIETGRSYRMTFHGFGPEFLAEIIDLEDPEFPIASIYAFDETYTSGFPGLFNNGLGEEALTDSTFDNFLADALPDTDFDFLPDPWEQQFYGDALGDATADTDSDKLNSAQEYAAGTDPTDASSKFRASSSALTEDSLTVSFAPALPDRTYTLELTEDLSTWTLTPGADLSIDAGVGTLTVPRPAAPFTAARVTVTAP
ncbi:MAG: hypothetical protein P8J87_16245 [Verrucomicrobiales bacterium]|nr:hypothetical protein [Verrucomicrobiales bacterium]